MDWILKNWPILAFALNFAGLVLVWFLKNKFATVDDMLCVKKEVDDLEKRVMQTETKLLNVPTAEDIHQLRLESERLRGSVNALTERTNGVSQLIERVERVISRQEEYLLMKGRD